MRATVIRTHTARIAIIGAENVTPAHHIAAIKEAGKKTAAASGSQIRRAPAMMPGIISRLRAHEKCRVDFRTVSRHVQFYSNRGRNCAAAFMQSVRVMERTPEFSSREKGAAALVECPTCHFPVASKEVTVYAGRRMCRNCIAACFYDDEAEDDDKRGDASA